MCFFLVFAMLILNSRCFNNKQKLNIKLISNIAGSIIVKSYEQSEKVHAAMLARGYDTDKYDKLSY